jgi:type III restriction enzyme
VVSFVKNQGLNFKIPYTYEGRAGHYVPDYLIRLRDRAGKERPAAGANPDDLLTLVLEVTDPWDAGNLIRARFLAAVPADRPS